MSTVIWLVIGVLIVVTILALSGSRSWCACGCKPDECACIGAHCTRCAGCDYCRDKPRPGCNCDFCKKKSK